MPSAKAEKFRELREARGLSTAELSRRLGVDDAIVRGWENDEGEPGDEHVPALAEAFGVSQDELRREQDADHHPHEKW
jgi:transcriptional regulator with XRE-family HTH domain